MMNRHEIYDVIFNALRDSDRESDDQTLNESATAVMVALAKAGVLR
jgi:hypothetical protein